MFGTGLWFHQPDAQISFELQLRILKPPHQWKLVVLANGMGPDWVEPGQWLLIPPCHQPIEKNDRLIPPWILLSKSHPGVRTFFELMLWSQRQRQLACYALPPKVIWCRGCREARLMFELSVTVRNWSLHSRRLSSSWCWSISLWPGLITCRSPLSIFKQILECTILPRRDHVSCNFCTGRRNYIHHLKLLLRYK